LSGVNLEINRPFTIDLGRDEKRTSTQIAKGGPSQPPMLFAFNGRLSLKIIFRVKTSVGSLETTELPRVSEHNLLELLQTANPLFRNDQSRNDPLNRPTAPSRVTGPSNGFHIS
jgi:hypothetical protein